MTKILYIEDNDDNIYMLELRLKKKSYDVFIARTAEEGLEMVNDVKPDLILMDVSLPGMDGYEATRLLKENLTTRAIPIIVLTAHALVEDQEAALEAGAEGYHTKPVKFSQLCDEIEELTTKKRTL